MHRRRAGARCRGDMKAPAALLASLMRSVEEHGKGVEPGVLAALPRQRGCLGRELAVSLTATKTMIEGWFRRSTRGDRAICIVGSNAAHSSPATSRSVTTLPRRPSPNGPLLRGDAWLPRHSRECRRSLFVYQGGVGGPLLPASNSGPVRHNQPAGPNGTAREVADAVAFLCSPGRRSYRPELAVDGGLSLMLQDALAREVAGIAG